MSLGIEILIAIAGLIAMLYIARCMYATAKPSLRILKTRRAAVGWTFFGSGFAILLASTGIGIHTWWFTTQAIETEGTIVGMAEQENEEDGSTYAARFRFQTHEHKSLTLTSNLYESELSFQSDHPVSVLYLPNDPYTARINTFGNLWSSPIALCVGGLFFSALGGTCLWLPKIRDSSKTDTPLQTNPITHKPHTKPSHTNTKALDINR